MPRRGTEETGHSHHPALWLLPTRQVQKLLSAAAEEAPELKTLDEEHWEKAEVENSTPPAAVTNGL